LRALARDVPSWNGLTGSEAFPANKQERRNNGGAGNGVLKTEGSTDLWSEELLLYEIDLVNSRKVGRGFLGRIGSHTKPRIEYGNMGGGRHDAHAGQHGLSTGVRNSTQ